MINLPRIPAVAKFKNVGAVGFPVLELAGHIVEPGAECDLLDPELPAHYEDFDAARYVFETSGCSVHDGIAAGELVLVQLSCGRP